MNPIPSPANPNSLRIKRITESIINLPTLPAVVSKMINLVDNPKTSTASLARLISTDQTMTARILKMANSAYYGYPREISTVNMAIVVLGFNSVKEMGLSVSVLNIFKRSGQDKEFDIEEYWEHSIGCAVASRMIGRRYAPRFSGELFVTGLLHDIGKIILKQYMPHDFEKIMELVNKDGVDLDTAENTVLGTNHAQVGAWLAEKWNLPPIIVESIQLHHYPDQATENPVVVAITALADYICRTSGSANTMGNAATTLPAAVWDIFQQTDIALFDTDIDTLVTEFLLEFDKAESILSFAHDEH